MTDKKLDHYNPNYPYKKENVTIDKNNKNGYPMLESMNNGALFPDSLKNSVDMQQLKDTD